MLVFLQLLELLQLKICSRIPETLALLLKGIQIEMYSLLNLSKAPKVYMDCLYSIRQSGRCPNRQTIIVLF